MRRLTLMTTDDKELYFLPENHILEVSGNDDGTATLAIVTVITVKSSVEELREKITLNQQKKIKWLTQSRPS